MVAVREMLGKESEAVRLHKHGVDAHSSTRRLASPAPILTLLMTHLHPNSDLMVMQTRDGHIDGPPPSRAAAEARCATRSAKRMSGLPRREPAAARVERR